jgi:phospholipid transport system substrate-binding protein
MNNRTQTAGSMIVSLRSGRRAFLAGAGLAAAGFIRPARAADLSPEQATAFIDKTGKALMAVVNGPGTKQQKGAALTSIVDSTVDVATIGRFCLGRYWNRATPAQQASYLDLFHRVLVLNITGRVGEYEGVTLTVDRAIPRDDGIAVATTVTRPNNAPNRVDWLVSNATGSPRIIDVIAEGTSLRLTQRNDYTSYLSRNNNDVGALIAALQKQAENQSG